MMYCAEPMEWASKVVARVWEADESTYDLHRIIMECSPADIQTVDMKDLLVEFMNVATLTTRPQPRMFDCIKILVHSERVNWTIFLQTIIRFDQYDRIANMEAMLNLLREELENMTCRSIVNDDCEEFAVTVVDLFMWFVDCLQKTCSSSLDEEETALITNVLDTALFFLQDKFIYKLFQLATRIRPVEIATAILDPLIHIKSEDNVPLKLLPRIDQLEGILTSAAKVRRGMCWGYRAFDPTGLEEKDLLSNSIGQAHRSGVRSLTTIFMSFRVLTPVNEMVDTFMMFGQIYGFSSEQLLRDLLHATLLILADEQEPRESGRSTSFLFVKIPKSLTRFLSRGFVTKATILSAFKYSMRNFMPVWDTVDAIFRESTFPVLIKELLQAAAMDEHDATILLNERQDHIRKQLELHQTIIANLEEQKPLSVFISGRNAKAAIEKMGNNEDKITLMMSRLISSGGMNLESVCFAHGLDGTISEMSCRIAQICMKAEAVGYPDRRTTFDIGFAILARIAFNFPSLTLEELVAGKDDKMPDNYRSAFYIWCDSNMKRIRPVIPRRPVKVEPYVDEYGNLIEDAYYEQEMSPYGAVSMETRYMYRDQVIRLKDRQPFWNIDQQNYNELLNLVPIIGSVWLDEFKEPRNTQIMDTVKLNFSNIVPCFHHCACMVVALTQWLECQEMCDAVRWMSKSLKEGIEMYILEGSLREEKDRPVWGFLKILCRRQLEDIFSSPKGLHPVSITLKSVALRTFPHCGRLQVPDHNILKDGWLFAQRQNWFDHRALVLLDHCNRAKQHKAWIRLFINNMLKLRAQDVMGKAVESICAVLLLDPIRSLVIMLEVLFDYLLQQGREAEMDTSEGLDKTKPGIQHDTPFVVPLVKLAVQVLQMGAWTVDFNNREAIREAMSSAPKRPKMEYPVSIHETGEEATVENLSTTIDCVIRFMHDETKEGVFTPAVSLILHIVKGIASAPPCKSKSLLVERIPHDMLFRLGRLDPMFSTLEIFSQFCNPNDESHDQAKLRYLFMLRNNGGL